MGINKDKHMEVAMWSLFLLGLAHFKFSTPLKHRYFTIYKYMVMVFFISFNFSQLFMIPVLARQGDFSNLIQNLSVTLLYVSSVVKFVTMMGSRIKYMIHDVRSVEGIILEGNNETMLAIFEKYRKYNQKLSIFIMLLGLGTVALFFFNPAMAYIDWLSQEHEEGEEFERSLIFVSWLPFEWRDHYWLAYSYQFMGGTYGATITCAPDACLWSFMTFALMNLEILKYKLENLPEHAKEMMAVNSELTESQAVRILVNKCFKMHKRIIRFVENLDVTMNFLMLVDFFICSMQIGASILRVLFFGSEKLMLFSAAQFVGAILSQMMLFYWHANEILLESQNIGTTIFCSNWYNYDEDVKKDLQFMILRAQKPLLLNIGPFFYMSTAAAISILRATYSYIALMRQFYS